MSAPAPARLTFAGGGWVVVLAMILIAGVLAWALAGVFTGGSRIGDGRHIESYGFDLSNLRVPRTTLVASGQPRDVFPPLDHPQVVDGRDVVTLNQSLRRKLAVSDDRVLGVVVNGHPRAYPLRILNAHEVVNDAIGGEPVVVTYSGLCDSAMVFRARVAGEVRRFGVSGLLLNSNLVMYDRDAATPSLWSQLGAEAIAGPLAGTRLEMLDGVSITTWASWLAMHPETTLAVGDPRSKRRYDSISYSRYFLERDPRFPVASLPSEESLAAARLHLKSPVVAVRVDDRWMVVPIQTLVDQLGRDGRGEVELGGRRFRALVTANPAGAIIEDENGRPLPTVPCLWFAWHAFHPDSTPVIEGSRSTGSHRE